MARRTLALLESWIKDAQHFVPWHHCQIWAKALRRGQTLTLTDQATLLNTVTRMGAALNGEPVRPILLVPPIPEVPPPVAAPHDPVDLDDLLARARPHPEWEGLIAFPHWLGNDAMRPYEPPYLGLRLRVPLELYRVHLAPHRAALLRGHVTLLGHPYVLLSTSLTLNPPGAGLPMLADRAMNWELKPLALWTGPLLGVWLPDAP
ncbi:hypothetical protein [Deinococcus sp. QL22]|uniref:hypothetical protein n=1 Tax=Deinococcus sp. QL22 TaxID=2939437 RepID=UPI002017F0DA|nr:hypothetical protein [Deinococcus sp. QL22]UQN10387.1 hypothetical protein M1R55_29995 [Deinococcus sp. QL22]UQN10521.1 hypothetical protein M1R55_29320 [Deinococcus sp. QL22]